MRGGDDRVTAEPGRDSSAVPGFIERFAAVLTEAGFPRMPARIFAGLLVTDSGSLTAAELSEMLQVSPAAISGAVRYLTQLSLVRRERKPGSRRDHYCVLNDVWYEAALRRDQVLARLQASAREGVAVLGHGTPAGARMAESLEFFDFLLKEVPALMTRWRAEKDGRQPADPGLTRQVTKADGRRKSG